MNVHAVTEASKPIR